ncbi:PREDICTED: serine/arginine repetitive matrix protein 3-like [Bison bison bison]|uniref:Serine/arginine repetitive matrix protein 3-like n=1 Tax=Bison bison bison TaxID=43346 RepID=A0A6P3ICW9_BISBB|nr:PREDICTED: serine/arginine repetitive matrix protein 3-like [Bison bison bison]
MAGSPVGLHSPQPSGRGSKARATRSPPPWCNSHLGSSSPSPGLSARHRGERPTAQPAHTEASRTRGGGGSLRKWRRARRAGSHRNRPAHSHGVEPQAHPPSRTRLCSPRAAAPGDARPPPPSRRPASGSLPSAARGSSRAGSTGFSHNTARAPGGELRPGLFEGWRRTEGVVSLRAFHRSMWIVYLELLIKEEKKTLNRQVEGF